MLKMVIVDKEDSVNQCIVFINEDFVVEDALETARNDGDAGNMLAIVDAMREVNQARSDEIMGRQ